MRLRDLREDNDITQNQIALMLNIKQNTYSQYENGKREVPINILWKLADFYDVSIDYLVCVNSPKSLDVSGLDDDTIAHLSALVEKLRIQKTD